MRFLIENGNFKSVYKNQKVSQHSGGKTGCIGIGRFYDDLSDIRIYLEYHRITHVLFKVPQRIESNIIPSFTYLDQLSAFGILDPGGLRN